MVTLTIPEEVILIASIYAVLAIPVKLDPSPYKSPPTYKSPPVVTTPVKVEVPATDTVPPNVVLFVTSKSLFAFCTLPTLSALYATTSITSPLGAAVVRPIVDALVAS